MLIIEFKNDDHYYWEFISKQGLLYHPNNTQSITVSEFPDRGLKVCLCLTNNSVSTHPH